MNRKHLLPKIAVAITFAVALIFCIKQVSEPDVWWQIRTGQYIIENGEIPDTDVFSYTYAGDPWLNVKWLTEVFMAFSSDTFGPEFLMIHQTLAILSICVLLLLTAKRFDAFSGNQRSLFQPGALLALLLVLVGMSFRINGRPEMVSHVLTSAFLFLMADYRLKPNKRIFLFIPAMILWANMHEAYGVGIVLLIIFNAGNWFEFLTKKKGLVSLQKKDIKRLSIVSIIAILATGIHPNGIQMISHPFEIYGQLGENKFTAELYDFTNPEFWNIGSFIALFGLLASAYYVLKKFKEKQNIVFKAGVALTVVFMALTYLSLQAYRNIPFFLFVSFPLVTLFFNEVLKEKILYITTILLGLTLYISVGNGSYYERFSPKSHFGLRVDPTSHPIGASQFLKDHKINGNGYVDYLSSSYLMWDLAPNYKSYVDLRDLDVFDATFIENVFASYVYPTRKMQNGKRLFKTMDELDNFNYALVVNKTDFSPILQHLNKSKRYVMVHSDLTTTLFLKRNKLNKDLIDEFSGDFEDIFEPHKALETSGWAYAISKMFWPSYSEIDFEKVDYSEGKRQLKNILGEK